MAISHVDGLPDHEATAEGPNRARDPARGRMRQGEQRAWAETARASEMCGTARMGYGP